MNDENNKDIVLNVLSLEDSVQDFDIIREHLIDEGYNLNITRVEKEDEFAAFLRNNKCDFILADFNLPGFNAFGALWLSNQICPDTPFIIVSGAIGEETAIELLKQGAVDYVMKDKLERLPFVIERALREANEKVARKRAEDELRKSEERFRHVSSTISDISYSCKLNPDGRFVIDWMTGAAERITGYSVDEIKEMGCWGKLVIEEDMDLFKQHISGLPPGTSNICELRLRHKNGGIIRVACYTECIKDEDLPGNEYLYGALVDITKRKQTEENLQNSERKYRNLVENALIGIYSTNLEGKLLFANQAMCRMMEFDSVEEFLKTDVKSSYKSLKEREKFIEKILLSKRIFNYELELITRKGKELDVLVNSFISGDEIIGMMMDVSERKKAGKILEQSEEKFKKAFKTSPESINLNRFSDGLYLEINKGFENTMGYSADEVIGKTSIELNIWKNPEERMKLLECLAEKGYVENLETEFITKKGEIRMGLMSATIIETNNEKAILSVTRDITERKLAEQQLNQKFMELQRFHNLTVDREIFMINLKKEVNDLLKKSGQVEKYRIVE
jgi:PAS domain S-box-containing protein